MNDTNDTPDTKATRLAQLAADAQALREKVEAALENGDLTLTDEERTALLDAQESVEAQADAAEEAESEESECDGTCELPGGINVYAEGNTTVIDLSGASLSTTSLNPSDWPFAIAVSRDQLNAVVAGLTGAGGGALVLPIRVV